MKINRIEYGSQDWYQYCQSHNGAIEVRYRIDKAVEIQNRNEFDSCDPTAFPKKNEETVMLLSQILSEIDLNPEAKDTTISILKFIQKQPDAKHTAEGIAVHWVLQQRLEENLELVFGVIQKLVLAGLLEEVQKGDHQCYYRVNKSNINEIPRIIDSLKPDTP